MGETARTRRGNAQLNGRSPLKVAALSVLLERPGHGYDVAQRVIRRMGPSWLLEEKQIYTVLERLTKQGLVRSEKPRGANRPGQEIYYPTAGAERARHDWLTSPPKLKAVREDIHVRLALSSESDAPDLLRALGEYRLDLLELIEANAVAQEAIVSWEGRVMSLLRGGVERRMLAEVESIGEVERDLKEFLAKRARR